MNILHVNHSDVIGGAARAAYRIHRSLVENPGGYEIISRMRVLEKATDDPSVKSGKVPARSWVRWSRSLKRRCCRFKSRSFHTDNKVLHSPSLTDSGLPLTDEVSQADLLHLHWLGFDTLSIEEIGKLKTPIVWTLHDQWAFCGAEHYTGLDDPERFVDGYTAGSRPGSEHGPDLNRQTWLRKRRSWRRPMNIVCPSTWLADCARRSALMSDWPISVIPNPIDLEVWAPWPQAQARELLGLPLDCSLILFGADGGTRDPRKGGDLLIEALRILRSRWADSDVSSVQLVVYGQSRPETPPDPGFPVQYIGGVQDDLRLRLLYNAADVFVIPSRQDNLPNTGIEAHACGTPVVAFRTSGLTDIIENHITGSLADPFNPASLAEAISWVINEPQRRLQLGHAARQRAERLWNPSRIAGMYGSLYASAVASHQSV